MFSATCGTVLQHQVSLHMGLCVYGRIELTCMHLLLNSVVRIPLNLWGLKEVWSTANCTHLYMVP